MTWERGEENAGRIYTGGLNQCNQIIWAKVMEQSLKLQSLHNYLLIILALNKVHNDSYYD